MEDAINKQNLYADRITFGKWAKRNDQFSEEEPLQLIYDMFKRANPQLPSQLDIVEFGSAEGLVGEYFLGKLQAEGYISRLTIIDVVEEHLTANTHHETKKLHQDLLTMNIREVWNLGLARSILHYFSTEGQKVVLGNIYNALKSGAHFLSQNFIQKESDLGLYLQFNHAIGKHFELSSEEVLLKKFSKAGFRNIKKLGDLPTWHFRAHSLQERYNLSQEKILEMRSIILNTPLQLRTGFEVTSDGFTVPIPYTLFLMQK